MTVEITDLEASALDDGEDLTSPGTPARRYRKVSLSGRVVIVPVHLPPQSVLEVLEGQRFGAQIIALFASEADYSKALAAFWRADLAWRLAESRATLQAAVSSFVTWARHLFEPVTRAPLPVAPTRGPPSPRVDVHPLSLYSKASRREHV